MNKKIILLSVFVLVALVQLYFPARMIFDRELILRQGKEYWFESAPIDPSDPFRGEFITLNFKENKVEVDDSSTWDRGSNIYALLSIDESGFAKIDSLTKEEPNGEQDYIAVKVGYTYGKSPKNVTVRYPFTRYYMEETTALDAELAYAESRRDTSQTSYAVVCVKNGESVLKDVMIDNVSIKDVVREMSGK